MFFQTQVFRQIVCYLAELFNQLVCYLAKLFCQIDFPFMGCELVSNWSLLNKGERYLAEQFRQITRYFAEQFLKMTLYWAEQFRQIAHYLAEHLILTKREINNFSSF